jgi:hypothetical protein
MGATSVVDWIDWARDAGEEPADRKSRSQTDSGLSATVPERPFTARLRQQTNSIGRVRLKADSGGLLRRQLCHHHPRHFWVEPVEPTNAIGANDKVGGVENVALDEIQHRTINLRPLRLH